MGLRANARTERARAKQRLIIGPRQHAGAAPGNTKIGDVDYGPYAAVDMQANMFRWFDNWAARRQPGGRHGPPIRIFVMGDNKWRDEQEWPVARAQTMSFTWEAAGARTRSSVTVVSIERLQETKVPIISFTTHGIRSQRVR
jgi:predicted acyl esterase